MTRQRIAAIIAAIAIAFTGSLVVASPALAAAPSNCANQSVCGYGDEQYRTGEGYEFVPLQAIGGCDNVALNDQWSSVYNNTGRTVRLYKYSNCSGGYYVLGSGGYLKSMTLYQPTWNDTISSVKQY